ncbi:hypothetical protein M569_07143, partial [Genlisea aurea]
MVTYDPDPDVVRWGLQLFDGDPYSGYGYNLKSYQSDPEFGYMENNGVFSNCLNEQLSRLSVFEDLEDSFCSEDWFPHSHGNLDGYFTNGNERRYEDETEARTCGSCSSPGEDDLWCDEEQSYWLEPMDDEHPMDGEVGKRLNRMVPIPHIPKINGEIPSIDEATVDHQRLLDRLQVYDLVELKVEGDGNCQFRALSDQFYRTPEHHKFVREQIVNQLKWWPEIYEGYVPMGYERYLEKISKNGEWGDHVTLQAAADFYGIKILVITSFKDTCYIEILPAVQKSQRVIFLSFWAEVHYNSIYPQGE